MDEGTEQSASERVSEPVAEEPVARMAKEPIRAAEPTWPEALEAEHEPILDAVGQRLREVRDLPPAEHAAVYQEIHRGLQESLAEVDGA